MYTIRRLGTAAESEHDGSFFIDRPRGYDCYLMLFVKTKAVFYLNGTQTVCEPNTFILYNIGTPHRYKAFGNEYVNDWLQFDNDELPSVPLDTLIYIGDSVNISGYMELMSDAFYRRNYRVCAHLLRAILLEVSAISGNSIYRLPHSSKLLALRKDIYAHPEAEWTIHTMSEILHVSEPYIQELYKGAFGVTCGADVINARVEAAKLLLTDTNIPVTEIGEKCGYGSLIHFSRQFKKITGLSPAAYRKAH